MKERLRKLALRLGVLAALSFIVGAGLPLRAHALSDEDFGENLLLEDDATDPVVDEPADAEDPTAVYNEEGEQLTDDGAVGVDDDSAVDPSWGLDLLDGEDGDFPLEPAGTCASTRLRRGFTVVAQAEVDECFTGIGNEPREPNARGRCRGRSTPKKNHTYAWGMTEEGRHLWWGTGPNPVCTLLAPAPGFPTFPPLASGRGVGFACEFAASWRAQQNPAIGNLGDHRPPQIWRMNTCTLESENLSPTNDPNLADVVGLRSAGSVNDVVFVAGPGGAATGNFSAAQNGNSIIMLAFEASSGRYLGSRRFPEYRNVRQWLTHGGVLYVGVTNKGVPEGPGGGAILRWTGDKADPFRFSTVGRITEAPGNMVVHQGRIFISAWPDTNAAGLAIGTSGVWMGPTIPFGGMTVANASDFREIWTVAEIEPDPGVEASVALGPIRSWRGSLYWGTMHFPLGGLQGHVQRSGQTWDGPLGFVSTVLATQRSATFLRGDGFGEGVNPSQGTVRKLYGDPVVPVWNGSRFVLRPSRGGLARFGLGGFNYWLNSYVWQMGITQGNLFAMTYDLSDSIAGVLQAAGNANGGIVPRFLTTMIAIAGANPLIAGSDIWRFRQPFLPALPVTINTGGNPEQFGIRTVVAKDDFLWLGTAGGRPLDRNGGFKILRFNPTRTVVTPPGDRGLIPWIRWIWSLPFRILG